jgi:hypothetical protein
MGIRMVKPVIVVIITAIVMLLTGFALGFEAGKRGLVTITVTAPYKPTQHMFTVNETLEAGVWRVTVLRIEEAPCVRYEHWYGSREFYQVPAGMKAVVVRVVVENRGFEGGNPFTYLEWLSPGEISLPRLVTNTGRECKAITEHDIQYTLTKISVPDEEVLKLATPFRGTFGYIGSGKSGEIDLLYVILENEKPEKLVMIYQPPLNRPPVTLEIRLST